MLIINTVEELKEVIFRIKSTGKTIGLVPTMGALHDGHLSLIKRAKAENAAVVTSIFVNPVQFNNPADLATYPRTLEADVAKIEGYADVVFAPTPEEVYAIPPTEKYDFGALEQVMEGPSRPGHFNGVAIIVKRLFDWVTPDRAYFGEKDYQQLQIIKALVKQAQLKIEIVPCPIVREANGLAMSSRNKRLTPEQFETAANIYRILSASKQLPNATASMVQQFVETQIAAVPGFRLEYFALADKDTLQPTTTLENAIGCIVVYCGDVRLIDNILY